MNMIRDTTLASPFVCRPAHHPPGRHAHILPVVPRCDLQQNHSLALASQLPPSMKTKSKTTGYIVYGIAAAVLALTTQISLAGSANWLLSPQNSAWENVNNWTPGGPPNRPSDIATFAQSSQTSVNISTLEKVNSIVFTSGSASYDFSVLGAGDLIINGTGVTKGLAGHAGPSFTYCPMRG